MANMLNVENLILHYQTRRGIVRAVDGVSFTIVKGETMALVGESGCGKSSTANAIMRLLPRNVASFSGKVELEGEDLMKLQDREFSRRIAWKRISMVFQGAMNSLNPVLRVGYQVAEPLIIHEGFDMRHALKKVMEVMELVRLPSSIVDRYPHELSGGMKQRVVIAMALIMGPSLVILDEPTSALDVITQANIMNTLKDLKKSLGLAYIFITHDLDLASELADKVAVMYGGKIVELGKAEDIFEDPRHPYTERLIASVPTLRTDRKLEFIPGAPPDLINPPTGCLFHPRCPFIHEICKKKPPAPVEEGERRILCWLYARS
ncbi:ABC transporter ATP-binding protein [Candidatus Bathyarchaeota archaeon]|nr:ABC transporter ATP-binding protein [Candidatus Bathyarchaeota archaeon]